MNIPQIKFMIDNDTTLEVFSNQLVIVHKGINVKTIPFTPKLAMHLQYLSSKVLQELVKGEHHE